MATRKRVSKKPVKRKRTTKDTPLTKLDLWAIAANEIYVACRKAGMSEANSLAFAMYTSSYPDWIVDVDDPVRKPWDDDEESD